VSTSIGESCAAGAAPVNYSRTATIMHAEGMPRRTIAYILGHADPACIRSNEEVTKAFEALDSLTV
jgi:hypothetical protein